MLAGMCTLPTDQLIHGYDVDVAINLILNTATEYVWYGSVCRDIVELHVLFSSVDDPEDSYAHLLLHNILRQRQHSAAWSFNVDCLADHKKHISVLFKAGGSSVT